MSECSLGLFCALQWLNINHVKYWIIQNSLAAPLASHINKALMDFIALFKLGETMQRMKG